MKLDFPETRVVAVGVEPRRWGDFRRAVAATAEEVRRRGWHRGALVEPDGYRFLVGLFGLLAAGATAVLPANAQPGTLAALAERGDLPLDGIAEAGDIAWTGEIDAESCRLEFFTSGSTGAPKPIVRTLGELVREITMLEARWGEALGSAPIFGTVSHQHIFGLTFRLLWPLLAGRPFARFAHDLWEPLLAELADGAALVASPAHLARLGGLAGERHLAGLFTAGAPLPFAAAEQAETLFGRRPDEIYGSTETGAIATRRQEAPDTPWTPLPGADTLIAEDGRLRLRAPWAGDGGWRDLQDRVEMAGAGFRLLGRLDRIAKIAGKRIDLDATERAVRSLEHVADVALLVLDGREPVLAAVAVLTEAGRRELAEHGAFRLSRRLRADLADGQEPAARPRRWRFVDALPRNGLGKVSQAGLAALFEAPAEPLVLAVRQTVTQAEIDIEIPPDLRWFDGHFPEAPVLPGVVQLDWALAEGRRRFGIAQPAARDFQVKFKKVIGSGDRLTLRLTFDPAGRRLKFAYERDGVTCSTGSILLDTP